MGVIVESAVTPTVIIAHFLISSLTSRCSITVTEDEYVVHMLTREVEKGVLDSENATDFVVKLCSKYSPSSREYKFCPGIDKEEYDMYRNEIRFDVKSARIMTEPFHRIDSVKCEMWFQLGKRSPKLRRDASEVLCQHCVRLRCDLQHQRNRTSKESPSKKLKRQEASSHARLSYMSPHSRAKRSQNQRILRGSDKRKLRKYEHTELPLDCEQDGELTDVVGIIDEQFQDELEKIYAEADSHGLGSKLREVWRTDAKRDKSNFLKDQSRNCEQ